MPMTDAPKVPWLGLAFLATFASPLAAQDSSGPTKKSDLPVARGASFFQKDEVDFWGDRKKTAKKSPEEDGPIESLWAEPIRTSDGRISVYVPPKKVLAFLEEPTRENAREYLAWQEERTKKLKVAVDLLRELHEEKRGKSSTTASEEKPRPTALSGEILYFKKENCPWCAEEDKVLAALAKDSPRLKVRTILPGDAPELWREHGVGVVPTLVVTGAGGTTTVVRGFLPADGLVKVLSEVNRVRK